MTYAAWRTAVNNRLHAVYLITVDDAGIPEEDLRAHWKHNEDPHDFVEWFALKRDLDPRTVFRL